MLLDAVHRFLQPCVIPAAGDFQQAAHRLNRELSLVGFNELVAPTYASRSWLRGHDPSPTFGFRTLNFVHQILGSPELAECTLGGNAMNVRAVRLLGLPALVIGLILGPGLAGDACAEASVTARSIAYPIARRGDQVDQYHGIAVADPYRWMEDVDSPETRAWVEAEAKLTRDYLASIPGRDRIAQRLTEIWNYERWSAPEKHGTQWFYTHNDGLQNQSALFTTADPAQPARVLLDPNTLSKDGTVAFKGAGYSDDGRLMAYGLSEAGSDWEVWRIRDIATGQDFPDQVRHAKFT